MRKRPCLSAYLFLTASVFGITSLANAQEVRATIGGRVMDPQGALVPDAEVVVTNDDNNVHQATRSNPKGVWILEFLLPGHYHFTITAPGFKVGKRTGITLQAADNKQFDTQLQVGTAAQSVDVIGDTPLIDTTAATSGTVISHEEISEMPSASHVVTLLATLSPGVVAQDQNANVAHLWSYNAASQITADGGRNNVYSNSFQLDGAPDVKSGGAIGFIPPMDSVQEFRVQTNAYDASIGRQAGATINLQTKSGGKDYHGLLYEFNQNRMLNANLFQTNLIGGAVSPVHFNEFGGNFGGPVWIPKLYNGKQKTFFFFSWDDTHNINPLGSANVAVPTALERTGDFTQSYTTQAGIRYPIVIYDPQSVNMATGNRLMFPGDVIPQSRLNPIAQNILKYLPLPNTPSDGTSNISNNYIPPSVRRDVFPLMLIRADQNWSNSQRSFVSLRWHHLTELTGDTFGLNSILAGTNMQRIAKDIALDHVWTISSNKILDLRYSLNRYEEPSQDVGAGFNSTQLGFPASFVSLLSKPSFPRITGFAGAPSDNPQSFGTNNAGSFTDTTYHTWAGTLTHSWGNHTFRYGSEFWVLQQANTATGNQGQFDFSNSNWTRPNNNNSGGTGQGSNFAAFLLGLPNSGNIPQNATAFYSQHYFATFFQDDWRLTSKLTLNLGLRWDVERPVTERYNRLSDRYDLTAVNPISASAQAAYAAILTNPANAANPGVQLLQQYLPANQLQVLGVQLFAGVGGTPRTTYNTDLHEWQPRIGAAYQIRPHTVIRGGFGRFTQADYNTGNQNGFSRTTSLVATQDNYLTPYATLSNPFPNGLLAPTGSSLGALTNLGATPSTFDNLNLGRFYSIEYSLHIQQEWKGWLFEAGYSHNKTYNISWGWNANEPPLPLWKQLQTPSFNASGAPVATLNWNLQVPNPFYNLPGVTSGTIGSSKTVALNQLLNPNPLSGSFTENRPSGKNQYDAALFKVERRFHRGFSFIGSFTYSKLFEDTSFLGQQIVGPVIEHKLGGEDRPFHLNVASIWDIPVGRGRPFGSKMSRWLDAFVGGWELTGIYNIQSGVPVAFTNPANAFFSGKSIALPSGQQSLDHWFDTSQFIPFPNANTQQSVVTSPAVYPAWTGIQNLPGYNYVPFPGGPANGVYQDFANNVQTYPTRWNNVRASRVNEANVGLYKNISITEQRVKLQLRFDVFNLFNHVRFGAPDANPSDSTFGRVALSQQNQARSVELGAKLSF